MLTACKGLPPLPRLRHTQVSIGTTKKQGGQCGTIAPTRTMPGKGSSVLQLAFQHCKAQVFCPQGYALHRQSVCRAVLRSEGTKKRDRFQQPGRHSNMPGSRNCRCALLGVRLERALLML